MAKGRVPRWNFNGPLAYNGKAIHQIKPKDVVKEDEIKTEALDWVGFTSDYFLTAALAPKDEKFASR